MRAVATGRGRGAVWILLAMSAALSAPSRSQEEPIPSPLIEREEVQFVSLDLLVQQRVRGSWRPYRGVRAGDLSVNLGGRPVELDLFEDHCPEPLPVSTAAGTAAMPGEPAPEAAAPPAAEPVLYVLYFDLLHLKLGGFRGSFAAAEEWARSIPGPRDRVMIVTGGYGVRIVRPLLPASEGLLEDLEAARASWTAASAWAEGEGDAHSGRIGEIASMRGLTAPMRGVRAVGGAENEAARSVANSYAAMDYSHTRRSLENLETLMALFDALDGTKNLILFQETIRMLPGSEYPFADILTDVDIFLRRLARAANRRNVRIYPVAAGGLQTAVSDPSLRAVTPAAGTLDGLADDAMTMLASETGGRVVERTNELNAVFQQVADDSSCFYRIGFRVPSRHTGDAERIAIQVGDGRGVRVRHRKSVDDPTQEQLEVDLVRGALLDPAAADAFPVAAVAAPLFHYEGGARIRMQIEVPAESLLALRSGEEERQAHLQIGGVILPRLREGERRGRGILAEVDVGREPWSFASGAVLTLPEAADAAGRRVTMVREIDAAPGDYWMIAVVEDELARVVGSGVTSFEVPGEPPPLGPILLADLDDGALVVEAPEEAKGDREKEGASAPRSGRVRPVPSMLPGELLLSAPARVAPGEGGRFLYGVCDTLAGDGRQPSFHGWALRRSLRCGGRPITEPIDGRRIPVPGREAECFVVIESLPPPEALPAGECRYEVTVEPPGSRPRTRSLPFTVAPTAEAGPAVPPADRSVGGDGA